MKKLFTVLLLSVTCCLGAKAIGTDAPIISTHGHSTYHMDVTLKNNKKLTFESKYIHLTACNSSQKYGMIFLGIRDDTPDSYGKIKKAMDEMKGKIPDLIYANLNDQCKNGIIYLPKKSNSKLYGYVGGFVFQFEDIDKIELY